MLYKLKKGKKPSLSYLWVLGSKCYILYNREHLGKFDFKGHENIFLVYSLNNRAYHVYALITKTIIVSTVVVTNDADCS